MVLETSGIEQTVLFPCSSSNPLGIGGGLGKGILEGMSYT